MRFFSLRFTKSNKHTNNNKINDMGAFPSLQLRNVDCWVLKGKSTPEHKTQSMGAYLCQDFKSTVTSKENVSQLLLPDQLRQTFEVMLFCLEIATWCLKKLLLFVFVNILKFIVFDNTRKWGKCNVFSYDFL